MVQNQTTSDSLRALMTQNPTIRRCAPFAQSQFPLRPQSSADPGTSDAANVELLRHQFTDQPRIVSGLATRLLSPVTPPQLTADRSQRGALLIRELQPNWRMCPEDLVLRDKVFDLKQQILIEQPPSRTPADGHLEPLIQSASCQVVYAKSCCELF